MKKSLTVMTGLGVGVAAVYLFGRAKRRPRGGAACEVEANGVGVTVGATGARPRDVGRQTSDVSDGAAERRGASSRGAVEAAVNSYVATPGRPDHSAARGWRTIYRAVCRLSFRACLCAAGWRVVSRLSAGKAEGRPTDFGRKKFWGEECLLVAGYAALAFLARLSLLRLRPASLTPDGVYYATLGRRLVAGNLSEGLSTFWSPLYPLLTGLSSLVTRDAERGGRMVSVVAGSLSVVAVYLLARNLYGVVTASVGALLVAAHPVLARYSTLLLTESTYTLLFTVALLLGLNSLSTLGRRKLFATGAALGACYLTKPEAAGYAGLMSVMALCAGLARERHAPAEVFFDLLALASGFLLLAAPYLLFLRRATGRWTISDKFRAHVRAAEGWARRWYGLADGRRTTLADRMYAGVMRDGVRPEGRRAATPDARGLRRAAGRGVEALKEELRLLVYHLIPPQLMLLTGLGLFRAEWPKDVYLLSFFGATLAGYALCPDDVSDRLLVPLLPLSLCWAARGISAVGGWLVRQSARVKITRAFLSEHPSFVRPLVLAALLLSLLPWFAHTLAGGYPGQQLAHRRAGVWVREHAGRPALIMATNPYTSFYADGRPLYMPAEDYQTVLAHARRHGVDYLVIDEEVISAGHWGSDEYSALRFLLDERGSHPGLRLVYKFDAVPNHKLLIYTLT